MSLRLITPAASYPVSLVEAKAHLHEDADDFDSLITTYIAAATDYAERFTGRSLVEQIWELVLNTFPDAEIKITLPPIIEVVSIKYDDGAGVEQTLATDQYRVDTVSQPGVITPTTSWPSTLDATGTVRIRYLSGYVDDASPAVSNVPASIKAAILITVGTLYAHRESVVVGQVASLLPWSAEQLLRKYRIHTSIA